VTLNIIFSVVTRVYKDSLILWYHQVSIFDWYYCFDKDWVDYLIPLSILCIDLYLPINSNKPKKLGKCIPQQDGKREHVDDGESRLQLDQGHIHSAVALESSGNTPEHNSHNFPMPSSRLPEACCPANLNFIMMAQCTNLQRIYIVHMR
jgi:hypothetical protein